MKSIFIGQNGIYRTSVARKFIIIKFHLHLFINDEECRDKISRRLKIYSIVFKSDFFFSDCNIFSVFMKLREDYLCSKRNILRFRFHCCSRDKYIKHASCKPTPIANVLWTSQYSFADKGHSDSQAECLTRDLRLRACRRQHPLEKFARANQVNLLFLAQLK